MIRLQDQFPPPKFKPLIKRFGRPASITMLDIGLANGSAPLARKWFPNCHYHGADIVESHISPSDRSLLDAFYLVGPDGIQGYDAIADESFDAIILNHVLEHLVNPLDLLITVSAKLKPGGIIFAAFPSPTSLRLPSGSGTLHFCDDPTHVTMIDIVAVVNCLLRRDIKIIYAGPTRDWLRIAIGAIILPWAFVRRLLTGQWQARGLWYVLGFEDSVVGIKRSKL